MADWDVIVVGGGLGGMIAANYLASLGKRTAVLERGRQCGGNMSGFRRRGFAFDGGDQSFESLGVVFPILEELGLYDRISWRKARFRMISKDFDFFIDSFDVVEESLFRAFPAEERGLRHLFSEIREVSRFLSAHCDPRSFPLLHSFSLGRAMGILPWLPKFLRWLSYDYRVKACSVIRDPSLRAWFSGIGYRRMPFIFLAGFWHLWLYDYWYPSGGMQGLFDLLAARLESEGGKVLANRTVARFDVAEGVARAVLTDEGERFEAERFVYAGDYKKLVSTVLGPGFFKPAFVRKIEEARLTEELLCVYLGLDMKAEDLHARLGAQHVFHFPNYDALFPDASSPEDVHRRMWVALNHFGTENPDGAPPGKTSLVLQTYSSYEWQDRWRNGSSASPRTDAYRELKRRVGLELVERASAVIPGLASAIEYFDVGTPLSGERFSANTRGSSGGWIYDTAESPVFRFPGFNLIRTPVPNILVCGHYSLWPGGVISAALSGKVAANLSAGRRPLARLRE